jgi:tetratricopeptide (TPR) repeat protein
MAAIAQGQAPSAIQFFMPDRSLPSRELRFTLTREDGLIEILFTDTKGKFQITGALARDLEYTVTVQSDGRTFDTTTARFRILRNIAYVPIFLKPLKAEAPPPKEVLDLTLLDAKIPAEARAAYEQAMQKVNAGKTAEAIGDFQRAVSLYPPYLRALNDLGVLYLKLNRLEEAAAAFTQAISLNSRFHYARLNLGIVLNRQGKHAEAIRLFSQLLKENPSLTSARVPYAEALAAIQQWDEAATQLRAALSDSGLEQATRAEAHFKLGLILNREERYAAAVAELEKAVALNPQSALAHLYLGAALLQLKRVTDAERELLRAYELGGKKVGGAQLLLGQLYFMQQKYEPAQRAFEQYLQDVPNAPNAAQIKEAIEKIRAALKQK